MVRVIAFFVGLGFAGVLLISLFSGVATEIANPRIRPEVQVQPRRCKAAASATVEAVLWMRAPGKAIRQTAIRSWR